MGNKYKQARKYFEMRDFTAKEIQDITGVDITTARRYRRERKAPEPVWRLLAFTAAGFLMPDGFAHVMHFHGEHLHLDNGEVYSLGELMAWHWNKQAMTDQIKSLENRIARLQAKEIIQGRKNGDFGPPKLLDQPAPKHREETAQRGPKKQRF